MPGALPRFLSGARPPGNGPPGPEIENLGEVRAPGAAEAAARAAAAGASGALRWLGAGETAHVFRDAAGVAWKVARSAGGAASLEREADWLRCAAGVPGARRRVASLRAWHPGLGVIERECPMPGPRAVNERRLLALHNLVGSLLWSYGWTTPEWKPDAWVLTAEGPKLVDAGRALRVGWRYARYVADVLAGRALPHPFDSGRLAAWVLRRDAPAGPARAAFERLAVRAETSWPSAPAGGLW